MELELESLQASWVRVMLCGSVNIHEFPSAHLQQVSVMDLHAAAGALVLCRRRRAEAGGLRRTGLPGLLLHLRLRLRQKRRFYKETVSSFRVVFFF